MKHLLIFGILFSLLLSATAQDSYYKHISLGKNKVGYSDTIIYDNEISYNQYGYEGKAPMFVQIWFPTTNKYNKQLMNLGDYQFETVPEELKEVYHALTSSMDEIFIKDGISYNILTDEPINYGTHNTTEILNKLKLIETKSTRLEMKSKTDYPIIVYHHGSQGLSYENSIMAEYFASHGYIFITSNFHLPYPNTIYGLLPYALEKENKHNQSSAKTLISFAKSITSNSKVFYIGHSWGAQEGCCFLNDSSFVDGFVSMETTIEFKTDTNKIKEMWPYVYEAIKTNGNKFSIPILLFAASEASTNFSFFKGLSSKEMIYASYKKTFAHNSYTSMYMMRYFLSPEFRQPDYETLLNQIKGYSEHIKLIKTFFESVQEKKIFKRSNFENDFYFD